MGFFSASKTNDAGPLDDDRSVVRVVRSRFYGKYKGKEREGFPDYSPSLSSSWECMRSKVNASDLDKPGQQICTATDAITATLAQRLSELAAANSEGLLNDEEYRLLRQNLFERLAGSSPVPIETSVVPVTNHGSSQDDRSQKHHSSTPATHMSHNTVSGFAHSRSIRTKSSKSSIISNIFAFATPRRASVLSKYELASDASSIFSSTSKASNLHQQQDSVRASTRKLVHTVTSPNSHAPSTDFDYRPSHQHFSNGGSCRSVHSIRGIGKTTPPSSFPTRVPLERTSPLPSHDISPDDDMKTVQELRQELVLIEAEGRRLLDAFNGLELTALTRNQHKLTGVAPVISSSPRTKRHIREHSVVHSARNPEIIRRRGQENDSLSVLSKSSSGIALSRAVSYRRGSVTQRANFPSTTPIPTQIIRKNSLTSIASRTREMTGSPILSHSRLEAGGSLGVNLHKFSSRMSVDSQSEDEEITALEAELAEIRRRRMEVTARYQTRLEYIRAKLKSAELREKLLKK